MKSGDVAYEACDSDCDCIGKNSIKYADGAEYKYFSTGYYGNVDMKYFEKCTDCDPSTGSQTCVYSKYLSLGYHPVGDNYGGCYNDENPDENEGGYFDAYNYLKDTHNCIPSFGSKANNYCYWSCKKN